MKDTYVNIKHIVVDEAQHFRTEDGDWYAKAKSIIQTGRDGPGVLYVFLDYFQTNHLCCSGLPELQHQEPVLKLTRMLRNGDDIVNYLQGIMQQIRDSPPPNVPPEALNMGQELELTPSVTNSLETTNYLNLEQMAIFVAERCWCLWGSGYYPRDVAVLCSKAKDVVKFKEKILLALRRRTMSQISVAVQVREELDNPGNHIVLAGVHQFSGMERSIVFGIVPVGSETDIFYNVLLCLASRARTHLYIRKVLL